MKITLRRCIYKNGLDIIAPLKCGTRWLEGLDVENRIDTFGIDITDLEKHIHSGTTFIWRPVREHFLSGTQTELSFKPQLNIIDIVTNMIEGGSVHWYPYLYKKLYPLHKNLGFRFYKLQDLSELTLTDSKLHWSPDQYKFKLPTKYSSIETELSNLPYEHSIQLEKLISEEEKWIKLMVGPHYNGKNW